ncbi:hypothetical protein [Ktedonobacter sp. SOSP1-85]|uniref:hypothetical protein n=1 Tax=Ktedonobacter sp. SOSP1-85 TaxID=2778367 RepID=UPI0019160156|nr:hypothetical protein [Ktedonobacter sp. SOSP1-85]
MLTLAPATYDEGAFALVDPGQIKLAPGEEAFLTLDTHTTQNLLAVQLVQRHPHGRVYRLSVWHFSRLGECLMCFVNLNTSRIER